MLSRRLRANCARRLMLCPPSSIDAARSILAVAGGGDGERGARPAGGKREGGRIRRFGLGEVGSLRKVGGQVCELESLVARAVRGWLVRCK
jgi:hypothetical protein